MNGSVRRNFARHAHASRPARQTSEQSEHGEHSPVHPRLSKRQLEVLGLLAEGKTNAEIARTLSRSPHTNVSAILRQLNVKSRTKAAFLASAILKRQAPVRQTKKPG